MTDDNTDMTWSFVQIPEEQAVVMVSASHRFYRVPTGSMAASMAAILGLGILTGVALALNERYVMPLMIGAERVAQPIDQARVALGFLPLAAMLVLTFIGSRWRARRQQHAAIIRHLGPARSVSLTASQTDVAYRENGLAIRLDWRLIRAIAIRDRRIEIDAPGFCLFIPERALRAGEGLEQALARLTAAWEAGRSLSGSESGTGQDGTRDGTQSGTLS